MTGEAIMAISVSVVSLVQLVKWAGLPDKLGPFAVILLALLGTAFWGWSQNDFIRESAFGYFAGWIVVTTSAAGVFGFTRVTGEGIAKMTAPPMTGAGSELTIKDNKK